MEIELFTPSWLITVLLSILIAAMVGEIIKIAIHEIWAVLEPKVNDELLWEKIAHLLEKLIRKTPPKDGGELD